MSIPKNITKEHLLAAISKIDNEGVPKGGDSQFYDVVYNGKKYPPKLVISYSNIFANGAELNRNNFEGGIDTECFKLLYQHGFIIEKKTDELIISPRIWFVTQGSTFTAEKGMKFLWAPEEGKDGKKRFYWENLLKVKTGDIIFHYSEGLKGVSIATSDGYNSENADLSSPWLKEGVKVEIDITPIEPFISRDQLANNKNEFKKYLSSVSNKPFNADGGVNQGYLYEFTKEAGKLIRNIYGKQFGSKIIDNFFDTVNLEKLNLKMKHTENFDHKVFFNQSRSAQYFIDENISCRFVSSLLTKPFVILTGLSGSGKTKLAQVFALWICENKNQYCIVPVGADWTNREPLLGFPNALKPREYVKPDNRVLDLIIQANKDLDNPYFLILDEMNLSHVERYFADFLSVMESKGKISLHPGNEDWNGVPAEIGFPKNLFIIGTVNIDETTYMFSPKVLDRANVIEFSVTVGEMKIYLQRNPHISLETLKGVGASMASSFVDIAKENYDIKEVKDITLLHNALNDFFKELKKTGAEFGYRSASEILRFAAVVNKIESAWTITDIVDTAIMQKLLPKVHGSKRKLEPVLKTLGSLCLQDHYKFDDILATKTEIDFTDSSIIKYPISLEKILRMYENLISNGFTSYAEA